MAESGWLGLPQLSSSAEADDNPVRFHKGRFQPALDEHNRPSILDVHACHAHHLGVSQFIECLLDIKLRDPDALQRSLRRRLNWVPSSRAEGLILAFFARNGGFRGLCCHANVP
jgi:hypothetical protein